jgi:hypothetical protein
MNRIRIRDLQKMSGETTGTLPGPTPVKSGDRTIGLLVPLKVARLRHEGAVFDARGRRCGVGGCGARPCSSPQTV